MTYKKINHNMPDSMRSKTKKCPNCQRQQLAWNYFDKLWQCQKCDYKNTVLPEDESK